VLKEVQSRKEAHKKVKLVQRVNLEQISRPLNEQKRARVKDVVDFLRRKKKIEQLNQELDDDYFEGNYSLEELDSDNVLIGEEIESFWGSLLLGESSEYTKQKKLKRLEYRNELTKRMNPKQYLDFSESTKISFTRPLKRGKFIQWSRMKTFPISFNNECIDVLGQLTYEFVEDIARGAIEVNPNPSTQDIINFLRSRIQQANPPPSASSTTATQEKGTANGAAKIGEDKEQVK
jgi:hypothetical protein